MPPRARSTTQGRVSADFSAHDRAPSQRASLGRPQDNNYTLDRGHSSLDNAHIDPSLSQMMPLGE